MSIQMVHMHNGTQWVDIHKAKATHSKTRRGAGSQRPGYVQQITNGWRLTKSRLCTACVRKWALQLESTL